MQKKYESKRYRTKIEIKDLQVGAIVRQLGYSYISADGESYAKYEDFMGEVHEIHIRDVEYIFSEELEPQTLFDLLEKHLPFDFEENIKDKVITDITINEFVKLIEKEKHSKSYKYKYVDINKVKNVITEKRKPFSGIILNPDICVYSIKNGYLDDDQSQNEKYKICNQGDYYRVTDMLVADNEIVYLNINSLITQRHHWNVDATFNQHFEIKYFPYSDVK